MERKPNAWKMRNIRTEWPGPYTWESWNTLIRSNRRGRSRGLARQLDIRYENGKADPREGAFPLLYLGFKYEENKRPENWQSSPPAGNKKSARRDSNSTARKKVSKIKEECTLSIVCLQTVYNVER